MALDVKTAKRPTSVPIPPAGKVVPVGVGAVAGAGIAYLLGTSTLVGGGVGALLGGVFVWARTRMQRNGAEQVAHQRHKEAEAEARAHLMAAAAAGSQTPAQGQDVAGTPPVTNASAGAPAEDATGGPAPGAAASPITPGPTGAPGSNQGVTDQPAVNASVAATPDPAAAAAVADPPPTLLDTTVARLNTDERPPRWWARTFPNAAARLSRLGARFGRGGAPEGGAVSSASRGAVPAR